MGKVEDLQKLKQLKDSGTITEIEFEIEKQKILNETVKQGNTDKKATKAMIGFILGLCSIIAWFIPIIGYPVTITGIVFSAIGINTSNRGKALAGLTLSIIFLVITLINSFMGVLMTSYLYY